MSEGRKIHCLCGEYLGEIRDATLKRELAYLCQPCSQKFQEMFRSKAETSKPRIEDIFPFLYPK